MIKILINIDEFILDKIFQKIADMIMNHTGKTNFWLTIVIFKFIIVIFCVRIIYDHSIFTILISICFNVITIGAILGIKEEDSKWLNLKSKDFSNPRRLDHLLRLACLYLTISIAVLVDPDKSTVLNILDNSINILLVCSFYFLACTPKPPNLNKQYNKIPAKTVLAD